MNSHFPLPKLFLLAAGLLMFYGFIGLLFINESALDIHLHDTYIVIARFHVVMVLAIFLLIISGLYYVVPRLSGRRVFYGLGIIHFACTLLGMLMVFWPIQYEGITGPPKRYYDYSATQNFYQFTSLNILVSIVMVFWFLAQVVFVFNLLVSAVAGKRIH